MNRRACLILSAVLATTLAGAAGVVACTSPQGVAGPSPAGPGPGGAAATPAPRPTPFPPAGKVFLGVQTNHGPYDFSAVDAFADATGYRPRVMQYSQGWAVNVFDPKPLDDIVARGMLPIISWEPWNYAVAGRAASSGEQPEYRLAAIIDGTYDAYIRSWAEGIAGLPYPVVMRFAHEMNGFWYPWCEQSNGNRPGDYAAAWRHVHDVFTQAGASNVTWLWSPNVTYPGATPLASLYPGDSYVDWIGLSGYYGTAGREAYISFDEIFTATIAELRSFSRRPVVITETGATNAAGLQAGWIREMFLQLPRHPEIIGVIWFEADKEIDWRIAHTPASATAFAAGAASPVYDVDWTPAGVPRTK